MTPEEFRRAGHALVDWIADYRASIADRPVMSTVLPGEIRAKMPATPPERAQGLEGIAAALDEVVMPGVTHWNHPRFFAYFPSNSGLASLLADMVSGGLGVQGMSWQTSPAATEIEEVTIDWLRQMVGLSEHFSGVIQDTASTATLTALLCARERSTDHAQMRDGLQGAGRPLAVYTSAEAHSSVEKAALLAGFGRNFVRAVQTDAQFAMRADALRDAIAADTASGVQPCAIVASVGTTATTAVDPVAEIARIAADAKAWLHVDAAMAGSAMILPECRWMWEGVEGADSLVFNPHKWLGVAFDCSAYYVRDSQHLVRVMSTNPAYLQTAVDDEVKNFRDWGIPLGRRFRSLKLWFLLLDQGVEGLRARLRRDIENARWLAEEVDAAPDWERVAPVPLQTVCVRHVRSGMTPEQLDAHNAEWVDRLNRSGFAYFTPTVLRGQRVVRVSVGAELTERADVEAAWAAMQAEASRSDR